MPPEILTIAVALLATILYAVLGGADFGGGIWDLLARGPRAEQHRAAVGKAMGPVWEANHVWLIFLIVLLFTGFPAAFQALCVALFVPFHIVLVGISLRGAAFVFRAHGAQAVAPAARVPGADLSEPDTQNGDPLRGRPPGRSRLDLARFWGRVFGTASGFTPAVLGMCLGAVSSGRIRLVGGEVVSGSWESWLSPFSLSVGALALAVCAYLAGVYLTLETSGDVQEDFRARALGAGAAMALLAVTTLGLAAADAPWFWSRMIRPESAPVLTAAFALALLSAWAVYTRRFPLARVTAAGQVALLLIGWGIAQYPYLIYPDLTLHQAAASDATLRFLLWTLIPGALLLIPSMALLFAVFKGRNPAAPVAVSTPADRS